MELLCGPIRAKSVQKIIHKRIGTYLRCQPHIHFLQVAWVDVGGCQLLHNFQLVVLLSLVELLVVIKADFVLTSHAIGVSQQVVPDALHYVRYIAQEVEKASFVQ